METQDFWLSLDQENVWLFSIRNHSNVNEKVLQFSQSLMSRFVKSSVQVSPLLERLYQLRRQPWLDDNITQICMLCEEVSFDRLFRRRHHCRWCGLVVCHSCSQYRLHGLRTSADFLMADMRVQWAIAKAMLENREAIENVQEDNLSRLLDRVSNMATLILAQSNGNRDGLLEELQESTPLMYERVCQRCFDLWSTANWFSERLDEHTAVLAYQRCTEDAPIREEENETAIVPPVPLSIARTSLQRPSLATSLADLVSSLFGGTPPNAHPPPRSQINEDSDSDNEDETLQSPTETGPPRGKHFIVHVWQSNIVQRECSICFEDFQVGERIAMLDCLCQYHAKCMQQWWDRDTRKLCPVHGQE